MYIRTCIYYMFLRMEWQKENTWNLLLCNTENWTKIILHEEMYDNKTWNISHIIRYLHIKVGNSLTSAELSNRIYFIGGQCKVKNFHVLFNSTVSHGLWYHSDSLLKLKITSNYILYACDIPCFFSNNITWNFLDFFPCYVPHIEVPLAQESCCIFVQFAKLPSYLICFRFPTDYQVVPTDSNPLR